MPETSYTTRVARPPAAVWAFVEDMDRWAPLLVGYEAHTRRDDRHSEWTLKGDVGILQKAVRFEVEITEWVAPARVRFTLHGLDEEVEGVGCFEIAEAEVGPSVPAAPSGLLARLLAWLRGVLRRAPPPAAPGGSELRFTLALEAGGVMGPMVNALLGPALRAAVVTLADRIAEKVVAAG